MTLADQPPSVRRALEELARRLAERFGDSLVLLRLFGSRARGHADAASDVDVAVVLEHAGWSERCAVIDLARRGGSRPGVRRPNRHFDPESVVRVSGRIG